MKTTLEFNDEDSSQLECALKGADLSFIIWDLDQWLRNEQKYKQREDIDVSELRDKLREIMEDYDISFNNKMFK